MTEQGSIRMNMKSKILMKIASASLLASGLIGGTAFAGTPDHVLQDHGTIAGVNTENRILTITEAKSHEPRNFSWNHDTRLLERDHLWSRSKPVMADQLQPGEPVKVSYQKQNDQFLAKTIVISHKKTAAASAYPHHS